MARRAAPTASQASSDLVERERGLSVLGECVDAVRPDSRAASTFLAGEAGVGKTALLQRFCDERADDARVLWGACDALFTPRPLGPFLDIAESTGGDLADRGRVRSRNLRARGRADARPADAVADDPRGGGCSLGG